MIARRPLVVILATACLAGAAASGLLDRGGAERAPDGIGRVVRIVDGDTIEVVVGARREKVRYIGIDTPETKHPSKAVECYGREASRFNAQIADDELVRLVRDVEERDRHGRLLAYVYRTRDGLFVNAEILRRGYARTLSIAPDVRHAGRFADLMRQAQERGRGLWSAC